jgi:hypothetical protein
MGKQTDGIRDNPKGLLFFEGLLFLTSRNLQSGFKKEQLLGLTTS